MATVTACHPPEKYGILKLENDMVINFEEKPKRNDEWVNAGYFILEPQVIELIKEDYTVWEKEPMKQLVSINQLSAFKHEGFYKSIDAIRDENYLEKLWISNSAECKSWE